MTSYIFVNTGLGNDLSPVRRQVLTRTNADLSSVEYLETSWTNLNQNTNLFIHEYAVENGVCKISAILFRPAYLAFN